MARETSYADLLGLEAQSSALRAHRVVHVGSYSTDGELFAIEVQPLHQLYFVRFDARVREPARSESDLQELEKLVLDCDRLSLSPFWTFSESSAATEHKDTSGSSMATEETPNAVDEWYIVPPLWTTMRLDVSMCGLLTLSPASSSAQGMPGFF